MNCVIFALVVLATVGYAAYRIGYDDGLDAARAVIREEGGES